MGPLRPRGLPRALPVSLPGHGGRSGSAALDALRGMFTTHVDAQSVAAIIFEPVQGEGGFIVPPAEWVRGLARSPTSTASC